jgi:glutathione S-transferase
MSALTLHDFALDEGCYRVRLLLSMLGLPYVMVAVDMVPGAEQTRPPLLLLNPLGTLPILAVERPGSAPLVLRDAEAILAYLAYRHDPARQWLPEAPEAFGAVMTWLTFSARDLAMAASARRAALFDGPADPRATRATVLAALRAMEDHMTARSFEGGDWFVGGTPTVADIAVFPAIALSRDIGIDHEAYPALRRWMRRFRGLSGFVTMPGIPDHH